MIYYLSASALLAVGAYAAGTSDYDYKQNGADWGTILARKYLTCDTGREQSPIDLSKKGSTKSETSELIGYNYYNFPLESWNFDESDPSKKIDFQDETQRKNVEFRITFHDETSSYFTPKQFHFHAPSEHSIDGELYDAEVHFVHVYQTTSDTETYGAVLGILFDRHHGGNEENPFI